MIQSFQPIIANKPKILVLGTLPSIKSLEIQQYYGNPRNSFWKILFTLFEQKYSLNYNDKISLAHKKNIAIWDVCYSASRSGSLDSEIRDVIPNKINEIVVKHPSIKTIVFNGQKAAKLYSKYIIKIEDIEYLVLLSTSTTNARHNFNQKFENWKQIL